jgi:hypothetical protein
MSVAHSSGRLYPDCLRLALIKNYVIRK